MAELSAVNVLIGGDASGLKAAVATSVGLVDKFKTTTENSAKVFELAFTRSGQAVDRLRRTLDPLYAASKRYESAVKTLDKALKFDAISQAEHSRLLDMAAQHYLVAGNSAATAGAGMARMAGAAGGARFQVQNLSYQIGDFAVQVAAGTSATRAFAQQFPQMVGGFGMWGAAAGAVVAILAALAPALIGAGKSAKSLETQVGELDSAVAALARSNDRARESFSALAGEFGRGAGEARQLYTILAQIESLQAGRALASAMTSAVDQFGGLTGLISEVQHLVKAANDIIDPATRADQLQLAADAINRIMTDYGLMYDDAAGVAEAMARLQASAAEGNVAKMADDGRALATAILAASDNGKRLTDAQAAAVQQLLKGALAAVGLARETERAAEAARELAGGFGAALSQVGALIGSVANLATSSRGAAAAAGSVADRWAAAAQNAWAAGQAMADQARKQKIAALGSDERGSQREGVQEARNWQNQQWWANWRAGQRGGGGGGGGGGGTGGAGDLEALRQSLMTAEQIEMQSWQRRQETLQAALDARLLTQQEYQALAEAAQQQHADKLAQIDVWRYGTGIQKAEAFFGGMAEAFAGGNEQMVKISKVFGAAQALIAAWTGAAEALKLPFPANLAAFAKVLATGFSAVNAIRSVSTGGGGGGGGGGRGGAAAAPARAPATAYVTLAGESYSRRSVADLFREINAGLADGYRIRLVN